MRTLILIGMMSVVAIATAEAKGGKDMCTSGWVGGYVYIDGPPRFPQYAFCVRPWSKNPIFKHKA